MVKTIEELEKELRDYLKKEKSVTDITVNHDVKQNVKQLLSDETLLSLLINNKKPIEIAQEYSLSRSAISQKLKRLKLDGLVSKDNKNWHVKQNVKDLGLPKTYNPNYEFQTIQILIPLKNPEILDTLNWDKFIPEINRSYKKYPYFKFTLSRTTKSILLYLHRRYIEYPEQVKEICHAYIKWCCEQFAIYDILLNPEKAKCFGLHLWKKDKPVEEEYSKDMGVIGVKHGVDSAKIFDGDDPKERKTWIESTPTPDGIESNDYSYFNDKKGMEFFVGEPREKLQEYMKKPTLFMEQMGELVDAIKLEITNKQLHQSVLMSMQETLSKISGYIENIAKPMPSFDLSNIRVDDQLPCPRCHRYSYPKLLLKRNLLCPFCSFDLALYYPYILQNKEKFKSSMD